jgi:hypothetical protein
MRKALNDNPMVQLGVCGVLLVIVGFFFMTNMKGSSSESSTSTEADAAAAVALPAGVSSDGAAPATSAPAADPITSSGTAPATPAPVTPPPTIAPGALKPGPGLPAPVVDAWKSGNAIVLLIAKESAVDDRLVRDSVETLSSRSGVTVFVAPAGEVARYSRITQGVGVNRVPALVVIRPRGVSKGAPEAVVSYGFRDSASVVQAVEDALYSGRDKLPYYPG